jgi:hypothetical protein
MSHQTTCRNQVGSRAKADFVSGLAANGPVATDLNGLARFKRGFKSWLSAIPDHPESKAGATSAVAARFAIFVPIALGHTNRSGSRPGWGLHPKYP